jgi:hypothetical protein
MALNVPQLAWHPSPVRRTAAAQARYPKPPASGTRLFERPPSQKLFLTLLNNNYVIFIFI